MLQLHHKNTKESIDSKPLKQHNRIFSPWTKLCQDRYHVSSIKVSTITSTKPFSTTRRLDSNGYNTSSLLGPDFDVDASDVMSIGSIEPETKLGHVMGLNHHVNLMAIMEVKASGEMHFTPVPTRCLATEVDTGCLSDPTASPQRTI